MDPLSNRPPDGDAPGWARPMNAEDLERFLGAVYKSIRKRKIDAMVLRDEGYILTPGRPGKPYIQHSLHDLIRVCASATPLEWPEIIDDHLDRVIVDYSQLPQDFESVKDKIKVQLLPASRARDELVDYPVSEQFRTVLAIDYPQVVENVEEDVARSWPTNKAQLYDLALQNVWEQNAPQMKPYDPRMPGILEFEGNDPFVATHALLLERHLQPPPKHGALVIVPAQEVAFVCPLEDRNAAQAVGILIRLARDIYRHYHGPVSPSLLWWRPGTFTNLPWEPMGDRISFTPPPDFIETIKRS